MPGITRTLARHIARTRREQLPAAAVHAAERSLLDACGVSLAASGMEPACLPFARIAASPSHAANGCTILGFQLRASPLMAAFANGALAHALDFEDTRDEAPAHPNAAAVPVALALAERNPQLSGSDLVTALALGSDLVCRLTAALTTLPDRSGFYSPGILGAYGAFATGAKLLALDEDQTVAGLALTLSQATSTAQWKRDPHSTVRAVRDAFSVQAGLTAALLAAENAGGFEEAIEGEAGLYALYARGQYEPAVLLDALGERYLGAEVSYKPWPSCRGTHAFIEAALALRSEHEMELSAIDRIDARGSELNRMLAEPEAQKCRPSTSIDARFSLPFCVALALQRGAVTLDDFGPATLGDAGISTLAERVHYAVDPQLGPTQATAGTIALQLCSGTRIERRVEHARGHPANPLGDAALIAKFVDCAGRAHRPLTAAGANAAADALLHIDQALSATEGLHALLG